LRTSPLVDPDEITTHMDALGEVTEYVLTPKRLHPTSVDAMPTTTTIRAPTGMQRRHSPAPLDLDVIEVSWMDHNIHSMRHTFFDINHLVVADLCELFSTCKRADDRTALLHRHTNVFSFLNAPRHIVNR
jgi:hypothetical protein